MGKVTSDVFQKKRQDRDVTNVVYTAKGSYAEVKCK